MDDTWGHYQDNRVEWFLDDPGGTHLALWRDAGVIALLFGGGAGGTTCACDGAGRRRRRTRPRSTATPAPSLSADDDGGYFRERAAAYYASGGLDLGPARRPAARTCRRRRRRSPWRGRAAPRVSPTIRDAPPHRDDHGQGQGLEGDEGDGRHPRLRPEGDAGPAQDLRRAVVHGRRRPARSSRRWYISSSRRLGTYKVTDPDLRGRRHEAPVRSARARHVPRPTLRAVPERWTSAARDGRARADETRPRPGRAASIAATCRAAVRLHHRRRRLGRERAGQPPERRSRRTACSSSRPAGRTGGSTPFIHMPAALTFPIGSRFYDWKYESEPEPFMNGRRIYHARGKVLGGSSSINGQIFQRGNPLDYERWAADPGMATWDYAHCLPYFKRMETCLAAAAGRPVARPRRPARPGARPGHEPALHGVLRRVPGGRLPPDRGRQRLPPGGLRAVRPEHPPGPPAERRAGLPPPGHGPRRNLDGPDADAS